MRTWETSHTTIDISKPLFELWNSEHFDCVKILISNKVDFDLGKNCISTNEAPHFNCFKPLLIFTRYNLEHFYCLKIFISEKLDFCSRKAVTDQHVRNHIWNAWDHYWLFLIYNILENCIVGGFELKQMFILPWKSL